MKSCILLVVNGVSVILVVIRARFMTTFRFLFCTVIFETVKNDAHCTNNDLDTLYKRKIRRISGEENCMEPRNLDEMMLTAKLKLWSNLTNITNILF